MSSIQRFAVRSNGRDLTLVRRPVRVTPAAAKAIAAVARPAETDLSRVSVVDPAELNKADLANLAVAVGVDSSGTKPEVLKRVTKKTNG